MANWNGGEVYANCLRSLSEIKYPNWELIVVDNGSTDGTSELSLSSKFKIKNSKLIKNKLNLGFAPANNQGYKVARGKYLLLLNNDTLLEPDFLNILVEKMEKESYLGVIQPKIKIMDNPKFLDNSGSFLTFTGFLEHWGFLKKDSGEFNQERLIFSAKGACMLIRKSLVDKIGLFDNDFGSYFEETDFCWRVWLFGYKVFFYPKTFIYHKVGFTSKKQNQLDVNFNSFKNRLCSLIKNLDLRGLLTIGLIHIFTLLFFIIYYVIRLKPGWSLIILRAIGWNIVNLKKTLSKRKKVSELKKVKEKEIYKYIFKKINLSEMLLHFLRSNKMLSGKHSV
jgi:GT2 family glycosyltransferase